jgi:DNA mismatch endonuclease (patch repair protein)
MTDIYTPKRRSEIMAAVRGRGNRSTEIRLIWLMKAANIKGWRRGSLLPGRPDFVFPQYRLAVFVDGCFWHGCPAHSTVPKKNREFWLRKILNNVGRDALVGKRLRKAGWHVMRIWEHSLTTSTGKESMARLAKKLRSLDSQAKRRV